MIDVLQNAAAIEDSATIAGRVAVAVQQLNGKDGIRDIVRLQGDQPFGIVHRARKIPELQARLD